jgi:hypothetical protein
VSPFSPFYTYKWSIHSAALSPQELVTKKREREKERERERERRREKEM